MDKLKASCDQQTTYSHTTRDMQTYISSNVQNNYSLQNFKHIEFKMGYVPCSYHGPKDFQVGSRNTQTAQDLCLDKSR